VKNKVIGLQEETLFFTSENHPGRKQDPPKKNDKNYEQ